MKKFIQIFSTLFFIFSTSFGQSSNDKIIFVIDSIPVMDDPEYGNEILETDVSEIIVIKNRDTLNRLGYGKFDGATFIFTKKYRNRTDSIKEIPSSKQMERKNGEWFFRGNLYSGRFIDYYYSGNKEGNGTFRNGKVDGLRNIYYQNGNLKADIYFKDGLENGWDKEYYEDGSLKQKGEFVNGKEEGSWESYYPNGQVKLRSRYKEGEIFDTATKYYSSGKIKEKVFIKNGKVTPDPTLEKINKLMTKSDQSNKDGDTKDAIKYCSKVIELDSTYAEAYFSRGTLKLNNFQFDDAVMDFDKALQLEPYMDFALANRAFARIRKYQFANSRTLSKNKEITVLGSTDKVSIPDGEVEKICNDLQNALFLGDKSKMIIEAVSNYCPNTSRR